MTPKEKAKELFDKYYSNIPEEGLKGVYSVFCNHAKKFALILVDEILDLGCVANEPSSFRVYDFYSKVKIELIKKDFNTISYDLPKTIKP
jgi:hypothetical protein